MKKLLITLVFVLSTVFSFSQSSYVATQFRIGDRESLIDDMDWSDWQELDGADIILDKQKLTIFATPKQEYLVGEKNWFDDVEGFFWNSYSTSGKPCRIYYIFTDQSYLGVEFDNIGIEYKITKK
jgi:hypothetical protein